MPCLCKFCQFQPWSNRVLYKIEEVTGCQIYLAGEETALSDFTPSQEEIHKLSADLGVPVSSTDYVWEIAQRLATRR